MISEFYILILGYIFGFYMAWNIGANDVANSMASAVGAKAITIRQAIFIAGILNIVGATFIGSHVTNTIRKGIVSTDILADPNLALIGALSALLSAALWVSFATWKSLPVSTTHSIVGAMIGFGIMAGGFAMINWGKLGAVVLSWIISPVFSMVIGFGMFKIIVKTILKKKDAYERALKLSPFFIGIAIFVVILSFLFKTPLGKELSIGTPAALIIAGTTGLPSGVCRNAGACADSLKILKLPARKPSFAKFRSGPHAMLRWHRAPTMLPMPSARWP